MVQLPDRLGFDDAYDGVPPWDIGRPQAEVVRLADAGAFTVPVLDAGCGTGENSMELASRGLEVVGIDASPRAIAKANTKARDRELTAEFMVADAFDLDALGRRFASVLDCGLFHVFDDNERPVYAASLASVLEIGGTLHVLCFSDQEPGEFGPRRVTPDELRATFVDGWAVEEILPTAFETNLPSGTAQALRASIRRV